MASKPTIKDIITFKDGNRVGTLVMTCMGFEGPEQYGIRVKLIMGKYGPFISFPSSKNPEGKYIPQIFNLDREKRDKFNKHVVSMFEKHEDKSDFEDFSDAF